MIAVPFIVLVSALAWIVIILQMQRATFWKSQIAAFEKADRVHPPSLGGIVFTGGSTVRYWKTLERDMAPLPVINRGFGGAHISHVNDYLDRVVFPYTPRAVVLYAGANDLGWPGRKSPETVCEDFKRFVKAIQTKLPGTRIYFVSINFAPFRRGRWPETQSANRLIREFASTVDGVSFIDVSTPMLDARGQPRADAFPWYRLHMTPRGYEVWTAIIKPVLTKDFAFGAEQSQGSKSRDPQS